MVLNQKLSKDDGAQKVDGSIYRSLVGSLIYHSNTRPNIVHAVSMVTRFMSELSKTYFEAAKRILRYIQGTRSFKRRQQDSWTHR